MSLDQVKNEIRRFLKSEDRLALCLRGRWGVGKTYTWDKLLEEAFRNDEVTLSKYAYVSLFGIETLSDVRRSAFENTVSATSFKEKSTPEDNTNQLIKRLKDYSSKWRSVVSHVRNIQVVTDYVGFVELGFLDVRDQIVCFDDLERKSANLNLKDILGLISFLKEKKRCKVILLLNSDALTEEDSEEFHVQLEKIVDINLEYDPTPEETIETAIPNRSTLRSRCVAENAEALGITNLRTMFRILQICERLEEVLKGYDERVITRAFHSGCLFAFALYQPSDAPSLEAILKQASFLRFSNTEKKTPKQIRDAELLRRYGFLVANSFDRVVLDSIRTGIYADDVIRREADIIADQLNLSDKEVAFTNVWNLFHNSFDDNGDEFAEALKQSIVDNAEAISPGNLSDSITILKQLGHSNDVKDIIAAYIDSRKEEEFWIKDLTSLLFNVKDPDVRGALAKRKAEYAGDKTLEEVAMSIAKRRGWAESDLDYLNQRKRRLNPTLLG